MKRAIAAALLWLSVSLIAGPGSSLPNRPDTLKFAVIGDNGTGDRPQFEVAGTMASLRERFAFRLVLMLGDNFYGRQRPQDLRKKFDQPYQPLLAAGVRFQAAIGNHDDPVTIDYAPLNMDGRRYYTFVEGPVRFFVLDTNSLDPKQVSWFTSALAQATEPWRIVYFHHPIYGNGTRHGASVETRTILEPLFIRHDVSVVFSGHDHVYERMKPQNGITYFVCGSGGKLRRGGLEPGATTAAGYDDDRVFLAGEIDGDALHFEAISRTGAVVDSGVIGRRVRSGT
jgi:3',5'-cyclic AMP phosphodiesterase CpdA